MELPEVEVMRRDLERDVVGKKIKDAEVKSSRNAMRTIRRHKTRKEFTSRLAGRKITKIERRGKYLLLYLDGGDVMVVLLLAGHIGHRQFTTAGLDDLALVNAGCRALMGAGS